MSNTQLPGRSGKLFVEPEIPKQTAPGDLARHGLIVQAHGTQMPPEKLLLQQMPGAQQTPLQQTCSSPSPQGKIFRRGDQAVILTKMLHSWHGFAGLMKECGKV